VQISNARLEANEQGQRLTATIEGEELWFQVYGDAKMALRGEPFFGVALLRAMSRGEDIELDPAAPVTAEFLRNVDAVQRAFRQWNPGFTHVKVKAVVAEMPPLNDGVLCSFSAGVDSFHSFLENRDEITHLLTIGGYDYVTGPKTDFDAVLSKMRPLAAEFGKTLVAVDTNSRAVCDALRVQWAYAQGAILCTLAVGLGFQKYIIPATHSYRELKPWGTHPLIDPLWTTKRTRVVHHGLDSYRTEKTEFIAKHPEALKHLQVCWHSQVDNCGECSKCVRTAMVLKMLGVEDSPIPCKDPLSHVDSFRAKNESGASYVWDVMQLAKRCGATDIERALRVKLRRYVVRRNVNGIVRALLSDEVRDRLRKRTWSERTVLLRDPSDFI
jgi:hypothetical protein